MPTDPKDTEPKPAPSEPRPVSLWIVVLGILGLLLLVAVVIYMNWSILSSEV